MDKIVIFAGENYYFKIFYVIKRINNRTEMYVVIIICKIKCECENCN